MTSPTDPTTPDLPPVTTDGTVIDANAGRPAEGTAPGGPASWQPLPPRAARLAAVTAALSTLVPAAALGVASVFERGTSHGLLIASILTAVVAAPLMAWLSWRRTRRTQWRLDDNAFGVRRARLWLTDTRIPRARVQHLDIQRGPLQRRVGLSTLIIHTAGSHLHALRLHGLDMDDAEQLRELLARPQDHDGL